MDYKEKVKHGTHEFPLEMYDIKTENGLNLYTHYHSELEVILIKSGSGMAYVDDKSYAVGEGDILFINSQQLHGIMASDMNNAEFIAVVFAPEFFGQLDAVANKYVMPVIKKSVYIPTFIEKDFQLYDCILELAEKKGSELEELKIKRLMFKIWELLIIKSERCTACTYETGIEEIKTAIDYMKSNYVQKIKLSKLAQLTNMSRVYFCKKFTQLAGITPIEYLIRIRIENSCHMLKNTNMEIGTIAMECGFSSFSYYSKIFKRIMGCTPKEYRNGYLKNYKDNVKKICDFGPI